MNPVPAKKPNYQGRIQFLLIFFLGLAFLVLARLANWQITRAEDLQALAQNQHQTVKPIPAKRGSILASDGFPLVSSTEAWLVWASLPDLKESPGSIAAKLAPILVREKIGFLASRESTPSASLPELTDEVVEQEEKRLLNLLIKEGVRWVPLKRKVRREDKEEIQKLSLAGIGFDPEERRTYPEGSMAAHLTGFVGKDAAGQDKGYFGLEGYYDLTLSGVSGEILREKNALGLPLLIGSLTNVRPLNGMTLKTHLDRTVQFFVEKELESAIERYGAKEGMVIVMRPQDGAILGMASLPAYEQTRFSDFSEEDFLNPVVGESFEPGSIFKIFVMASALDAGAVEPDSKCDSCSGPRKIGEYTIRTWNNEYHPEATMAEVIEHSDNVGMIWAAERLGIDRLYGYLERFGFGELTGIDLQDEATPPLRPKRSWGLIDLATASFGQGIAVTPIQVVRAAAAIANEGVLPVPQVVDKIAGDGWEQDIKPKNKGRVISQEAAKQITEMMVNATENGEARWAKPRGFKIAGKTGTAQIPVAGHYDEEKTIASFVGFAPAIEPKFVMLVSLREPTSSPWGSETAAPLWFSIAKHLFPYLGIQPESLVTR